jgi:hypothetical protein
MGQDRARGQVVQDPRPGVALISRTNFVEDSPTGLLPKHTVLRQIPSSLPHQPDRRDGLLLAGKSVDQGFGHRFTCGTLISNTNHYLIDAAPSRNFMSVNFFPSGAPYHARDWPFSDISCVSRAHRSELIPCIRLQIREIALTAPNPQRWARRFFRSALILTRHATTAPCRG